MDDWKPLDLRWSMHAIDMERERVGEMARTPEKLLLKVGRGMPVGSVCRIPYEGNVYVIARDGGDISVVTMYRDEFDEDSRGCKAPRRQRCQRDVRWGGEDTEEHRVSRRRRVNKIRAIRDREDINKVREA